MELTFLGTGAGIPTRARNVSAVALRLPQSAEIWLLDCGEGTQHQILRSPLSISQIRRIFITHLHGDHLFGLPGLLASGKLGGSAGHIDIYGPAGLANFLRACHETSHAGGGGDSVRIHEIEPGTILDTEGFSVECRPLCHRICTFGYRIVEHERRGRFRIERARELGIPEGPVYGRLKQGAQVTLADGRIINGEELCEPPEPGRIVAYCTDTTYCDEAIELGRNADVLIHEATFAAPDHELARRSAHSTATMAATVAREAEARALILTHISPRYVAGRPLTADDLLAEARQIFPNTYIARDFLTFDVQRRERVSSKR